MNWHDWKKRLGLEGHARQAHFVAPSVALELQPGFVAGARLNAAKRHVERAAVRQLEIGALAPSPSRSNLNSEAAVKEAIGGVAVSVGNGSDRLGLLIPDLAVRVALLIFESLPSNRREEEALVRWRMKEFLPFAPEEARVSYQILARQPNGTEVLGMAIRGSVLAEYEAALDGINGGPALVLPATGALLPLLPEDSAPQLLLHASPGSLTAVLVAANRVRFWRTRELEGEPERAGEELTREAARALATCQDQFGLQVQRLWFCARPPAAGALAPQLARALGRELLPLSGAAASAASLPEGEREAFEHFGVPFAGLVANWNENR